MSDPVIRPIRGDEWRAVRALRLRALLDPAAPVAFLETYDEAAARPDEFWQERAAGSGVDAGEGTTARQFVAIVGDEWVGSATVLRERRGAADFEGRSIRRDGAHVVGVYVGATQRGSGLIDALLAHVADWAQERGWGPARMYVHAENPRARRAYERNGFAPTGVRFSTSIGDMLELARADL